MWTDGTEFRRGREGPMQVAAREVEPPPKAPAESCRSRGDDGRGDPGKNPEPRGRRLPRRSSSRLGRPPSEPHDAAAAAPTAERSERPTGAAGTRSGLTSPALFREEKALIQGGPRLIDTDRPVDGHL